MARADSAQRANILAAAIAVFAHHGLPGASIRQVGEAAGVNSALLYYYFEDKETLFAEAVRFVVRGFLDRLRARRRVFAGGRERLELLVNGLFDYYGAYPDRLRLMTVAIALHTELLSQVVRDFARDGSLLPLEVLKEGVACGHLRPIHPVEAWSCLLGMCIFSLQMPLVLKPAGMSLPEVAHARQLILDGLCEGWVRPKPTGRRRVQKASQ